MDTSSTGDKKTNDAKPFAMGVHANHHMIECQLDFQVTCQDEHGCSSESCPKRFDPIHFVNYG
jgi:hypothetical protein